jgi:hypothetical protein
MVIICRKTNDKFDFEYQRENGEDSYLKKINFNQDNNKEKYNVSKIF